jgi:hypothetical protein
LTAGQYRGPVSKQTPGSNAGVLPSCGKGFELRSGRAVALCDRA